MIAIRIEPLFSRRHIAGEMKAAGFEYTTAVQVFGIYEQIHTRTVLARIVLHILQGSSSAVHKASSRIEMDRCLFSPVWINAVHC